MTSLVSTAWRCALCRSTTGDSLVTVTVSESDPTLRSAFTLTVANPDSSTPSRETVLNPDNVNLTE